MRYSLILAGLLAGCASTPPQVVTVERAVPIPSPPEFLPVPPALFTGCTAPGPLGTTNGDLLIHDQLETQFAVCLQSRLDAIRALK